MNDRSKLFGWGFVVVQFILFAALLVLPSRDHWPTPGWLNAFGFAVLLLGVAISGIGVLGLGTSFTPTPVPSDRGQLNTAGLYRYARHPIYTGVLIAVVGLTIRSGSWPTAAVGLLTVVFFNLKTQWEESQLSAHYPGYAAYSAVVPRFIPRPWRKAGPL